MNSLDWFLRLSKLNVIQRSLDTDYPIRSLSAIKWLKERTQVYFPQFVVVHAVKGFGIVKKAEVDVFLELSCFFDDPTDVGNLISGSSAFSESSLNIWKFLVHALLQLSLKNVEH